MAVLRLDRRFTPILGVEEIIIITYRDCKKQGCRYQSPAKMVGIEGDLGYQVEEFAINC